jgi:uncharacterized protein YjlB
MNRKHFLSMLGFSALAGIRWQSAPLRPETYFFKDDGHIPNNRLALLLYRKAFEPAGKDGASWLEKRFSANNWTNSWRNGVYPFHHYHSTSHEVLGIYSGSALLHLGGEQGKKIRVEAGDVIVIPAGVGHKNLGADNDFGVVGAYPDGRSWDLLRGEAGERPKADERIAALPLPGADPLYGKEGPLKQLWV